MREGEEGEREERRAGGENREGGGERKGRGRSE